MPRNLCYQALVLRSRPSGESNRELWLLCAEAGIVRATVFGGPKSKLRSSASPFHSGQAWIYHNPVKDTNKLSDFDVRSWRPGLRELYERVMAADVIAETILASLAGGGNWERALKLTESALDALEAADSETSARILVWFLWQWIDFLGLKPELDHCSSCEKPAIASSPLWYLPKEGTMVCDACLEAEGLWEAGGGCRHWLKTVHPVSPALLVRYTLDARSLREAQTLTMAILGEALGKRLTSWETCKL